MSKALFLALFLMFPLVGEVQVGKDLLQENLSLLKGKKVALLSNQSAVNNQGHTTFSFLKEQQRGGKYELVAVFAPEHGFYGSEYACEKIPDQAHGIIPIYSLHGDHRRPTEKMLTGVDLLVCDIQDIGSRSYTYCTTLFYCMEEAAKRQIPVIVLDRPNPMGGTVVDGPLIEEKWRSFIGYLNIPYCHGMTLGELAHFFNQEHKVGCQLKVIPAKGWKRGMTFAQTGLPWVPTSPQIPEPDTPFFYPTTGLIGHLSLTSIGVGYTLPFKVIGAPWMNGEILAETLNQQKLPGVYFQPFYFKPFFGKFKLNTCQGVRILITDPTAYLPMTTQFTILGVIKNLYPKHFQEALTRLASTKSKQEVFYKLCGSEKIYQIIKDERFIIWKLRELSQEARARFAPIRKKYLLPEYS
ncbi:MAG: hypothetical protein K940chlam9_01351 [Chlamydiae bacterium]|nr:hypothetical protein [Chlamydiota bacterium]